MITLWGLHPSTHLSDMISFIAFPFACVMFLSRSCLVTFAWLLLLLITIVQLIVAFPIAIL